MIEDIFKRTLNANIYDVANETPLTYASNLSSKTRNDVFLKREDLQVTSSFKVRGACNKIYRNIFNSNEILVTASTGNHAQGVALASKEKGLRSIVVMPKNTSSIKVNSVTKLSGTVILYGNNFTEAETYAEGLANEHECIFIPPFDDLDIIAGQGTVARETLQQANYDLDLIFIPVGGGGLIAGVAAYVKHLTPSIKIIGVECNQSACLKKSLHSRKRIVLDRIGMFAEEISVLQIGEIPFKVALDFVDDVVEVTPDEICSSVKHIFDDTRALVENSGAVSVAGMIKYCREKKIYDEKIACICSGGNANFNNLGYITERSLIGEGEELLLEVKLPETIDYLKKLCEAIDDCSIMELNYKKRGEKNACIFLGVKVNPSSRDKENLLSRLNTIPFSCIDITKNETAKLNLKYILGFGMASFLDENLYRVDFPEHTGNVSEFLKSMPNFLDITTFHYRNYGSARSSILIRAPEKQELELHLDSIGYQYFFENNNEAVDYL